MRGGMLYLPSRRRLVKAWSCSKSADCGFSGREDRQQLTLTPARRGSLGVEESDDCSISIRDEDFMDADKNEKACASRRLESGQMLVFAEGAAGSTPKGEATVLLRVRAPNYAAWADLGRWLAETEPAPPAITPLRQFLPVALLYAARL